jgi:hypothetical protein
MDEISERDSDYVDMDEISERDGDYVDKQNMCK